MPLLVSFLTAMSTACAMVAVAGRVDPLLSERTGHTTASASVLTSGLVARLGMSGLGRRARTSLSLERKLGASGLTASMEQVAGWKLLGAATGSVAGILVGAVLLVPLLGFVGYRAPDMLLGRAAKRRRRAIDAEIPQLLDLLAAGSSAGLAAPLALRRASHALRGPLADELSASLRAVDLGRRWREELSSLSERLGLPDMRRTVAALTRTEVLGASLSASVTDLAAQVRASRAAETAERARKAPVKMLFPLVFLVLPAFLLLTVVPVLLSTIRSIS